MTTLSPPSVYKARLSYSARNVLLVGAVSLFRGRPKLRAGTQVVGSLILLTATTLAAPYIFLAILPGGDGLGGLASLLTSSSVQIASGLTVAGALLLGIATLAGQGFLVYVGEKPEVVERIEAEERETDVRDPYSALDVATKRLNEYYAINQSQARGSFRWAVFAMFCGLTTITAGVWIFYFRETPDSFLTSLATAAGTVVNLISVLYLYLHNKTQKRSLTYFSQLVRLQQVGLLVRMADSHETAEQRADARNRVIDQILEIIRFSAEQDSKSVASDAA